MRLSSLGSFNDANTCKISYNFYDLYFLFEILLHPVIRRTCLKHINNDLGKEAYGFIVDVTDRQAVYEVCYFVTLSVDPESLTV